MSLSFKQSIAVGTLCVLALASNLAHAQASTTSLVGWTTFGDVVAQSGAITLTTAYTDGDDAPFNLSGNGAVDIGALEGAAGVATYGLDPSDVDYGTEGSLVGQSFDAVAGSTLSFDWSFSSLQTEPGDRAFAVIGGVVTTLANVSEPGAALQTFSITLSQSGPVSFALGVIDTLDYVGVSTLSISNLKLLSVSAIPEPTTGALMLGGLALVAAASRRFHRPAVARS
ncbi:MAG TPA: PEP-CTERM sorting domain-containing protein [Burkholderiaceae bacterium]|nr:PEP-CTERM sorting domain-containing protein [Burkholderiaceae bacterium]